jgi:hypothetical protein
MERISARRYGVFRGVEMADGTYHLNHAPPLLVWGWLMTTAHHN